MNILVTGIGGPTPKGIAKSLKLYYEDVNIIGVDSNVYAPGLYINYPYDKTYLVPNATKNEFEYWERINEIVSENKIDFAFIVPETEVIIWSKKKIKDQLPCKVLIPDYNVSIFLFDKLLVSNLLEEYGLSPKTIEIKSADKNTIHDLDNKLGYPYWVRLNKTAGAIGALKINSKNDLINWFRYNGLTGEFLASTYLPGKNYACKMLYNSNELVLAAVGERIEYLLANAAPSKISGMCSRGRLVNNSLVFERAKKALELVYEKFNKPIHGMFTVDFKEDINNIPLVTEINIRHVSFTHAFSMGGANFSAATTELILNNNYNKIGLYQFQEDVNFIRGVDNDIMIVKGNELKNNEDSYSS